MNERHNFSFEFGCSTGIGYTSQPATNSFSDQSQYLYLDIIYSMLPNRTFHICSQFAINGFIFLSSTEHNWIHSGAIHYYLSNLYLYYLRLFVRSLVPTMSKCHSKCLASWISASLSAIALLSPSSVCTKMQIIIYQLPIWIGQCPSPNAEITIHIFEKLLFYSSVTLSWARWIEASSITFI